MPFHNRLLPDNPIPDTAERVPFHTLRVGDRYQNTPGGNVSTVIRADFTFRVVRRYDDWLLHHDEGCWVWDKMVIKVAPLRK
jgi:hypothetical protein